MTEALQVSVRPLDRPELGAVEGHLSALDPRKHRDRLAQQELGHALYLIAWQEDRPLGHVFVRFGGSANQHVIAHVGGCPHLEDLFVSPRWRSRGVGTHLLAAVEAAARARGYDRVGLSVASNNARARRLYARLGYTDSGLGEYPTTGTYYTAAGEPRSWFDTSLYLIKELTP